MAAIGLLGHKLGSPCQNATNGNSGGTPRYTCPTVSTTVRYEAVVSHGLRVSEVPLEPAPRVDPVCTAHAVHEIGGPCRAAHRPRAGQHQICLVLERERLLRDCGCHTVANVS